MGLYAELLFVCSAILTSHYTLMFFSVDCDVFSSMCVLELKFVIYQAAVTGFLSK